MILPADLTELQNWVTWKYDRKPNGDETKVPYSLTGNKASSTTPSTWHTYEEVAKHDKIGFVFWPDDGIMGIDLDDCLEGNAVKEWARPVIERFSETYMEISPSGTGVKIFFRGKLPGPGIVQPWKDGQVEIYDRGRYFTVTGSRFNNAPLSIENCQSDLNWLLKEIDVPEEHPPLPENAFDMPAFITKYGSTWRIKGPYRNTNRDVGGLRWRITNGCPFQPNYLGGSPTLGVTVNGAATFSCFCGDHERKNWHDLTVLLNARAPKRLNGHPEPPTTPPPQPEEEDDAPPLQYSKWPEPLSDVAFHGPLGMLVRALEPHTEADVAAILFQSIAFIGNVIGHGPHFVAEGTQHFTNEFVCLVGPTAAGRKGSAFSQVRRALRNLDADWLRTRVKSGLTSGEGLIFHVRDEIREMKQSKGQMVEMVTDQGERDKRLLVIEEEFASAIKNMARDGNNLSGVIRQAWDSPVVLAPMTKNNRITASNPHISIIGHITKNELREKLKSTENTNGFANRFLWVCSKRSRLLPEGSKPDPAEIMNAFSEIDVALGWADNLKSEVVFDSEAREIWHSVYEDLVTVPSNQIGPILSRACPHVRRIALIYAVLDKSAYVTADHLCAAMECWRYARQSAEWVFDGITPEEQRVASLKERILSAITAEGVNRQTIMRFVGGRTKASDIDFLLTQMLSDGTVRAVTEARSRKSCQFYYR